MIGAGAVLLKQLMALVAARAQHDDESIPDQIAGAESALSDYIRKLEAGYEATALRARKLAVYRIMGEDAAPPVKDDTYKIARSVLGNDQVERMMAELAGIEEVIDW